MERLRRRIEQFRQHHNNCEERYLAAMMERQEMDRQQTYALHQRCLQSKAKRSNKHRQHQPSGDQAGQRAPGGGGGTGGEHGESGVTTGEQSRSSTLETLKRKLESLSPPDLRGQVNSYESFPSSQKGCQDNSATAGSPLDSKPDISNSNGPMCESGDGGREPGPDFHPKEMKQEPDDILPIMPPPVGNNSLFPELNEQEWTELMEELNFPVDYEDIQEILNDGFEDRKDPLELAATQVGGGAVGGGAGGGGQSSQGLLPPDLVSVKAEFSPPSAVFEQDSRTGSPQVRSTPSGTAPPHPTSSPVASSSASSPALSTSQPAPPRQIQPPPNHLLPQGPKDLSPAQQLQELAVRQQRVQHLHRHMQQQQPGAKFPNHPNHPSPWSQMPNTSQSSQASAFGMDKSTSNSLYSQDFNPNAQKQLVISSQPNKASPKAGASSFMPGSAGHPNMLGHPTSGPPLSHAPAAGAQAPAVMLNYNNTKPLSHYEAGPGPPRPTNQNQKVGLLSLIQQQCRKEKPYRPHMPHPQDQNGYPAPPHGPGPTNAMTAKPGNNAMPGNHGNAYMTSKEAAARKQQQQHHQQQILEQQKQQQYIQRQQQILAEQEKQRQRHLTRPPPQYQDQSGTTANQNPYPQQPANQFTASSQPMGSVSSMGGPAPGSRMFPQNQGMMSMNMGQGGGPAGGVAPPPTVSQADISQGGGAGVDVLYNTMSMHPNHLAQQPSLQRQTSLNTTMSAPYRHNLLPQQQHLKTPPNAAMLKQPHVAGAARLPASMQGNMGGGMPGGQSTAWQQQLVNQPPSSNAGLSFSGPPNAFHMPPQQQPCIPKMPSGSAPFGGNPGGRPMGGLNPGQQMMQTNMAAPQQRALPNPQRQGQPMTNQQQGPQNQAVLPNLAAFGQPQGNGRQGLQCNQGYQVSQTVSQQQHQVSFGYNVASGSFPAESDLVDSLLKGQNTQEWMADLDELLANHH
ncbi:mastermind-like protein 1 isoform X2 [Haplochromis burtoni]|nr:mastermind-like protein 1 isoform X2 [Haplochromis burtoni]